MKKQQEALKSSLENIPYNTLLGRTQDNLNFQKPMGGPLAPPERIVITGSNKANYKHTKGNTVNHAKRKNYGPSASFSIS